MKWLLLLLFVFSVFFSLSLSSSSFPTSRDRFKWPFANYSIWNLPIGASARYVFANITRATGAAMTVDPDVIILTPTSPLTNVVVTGPPGCWDGACRCNATSTIMYSGVPIPKNYQLNDTDNNCCAAILMPDMETLIQMQPLNLCKAGGNATAQFKYPSSKITTDGIQGAHGGSRMSSIGGTIRSGELVPGAGPIRHALKINLYANLNFYNNPGFRWPAGKHDSCAPGCYGGKNPALTMGSLLALPPSIDIDSMELETEPGKMIAWTLQNYGGYIVDNTAWNVYGLAIEQGPNGNVSADFLQFGIGPMFNRNRTTAWARDMDKVFLNLSVIDNWDLEQYNLTMLSNGAAGSGGGSPRQPWAPPFDPLPAPTTATTTTHSTTSSGKSTTSTTTTAKSTTSATSSGGTTSSKSTATSATSSSGTSSSKSSSSGATSSSTLSTPSSSPSSSSSSSPSPSPSSTEPSSTTASSDNDKSSGFLLMPATSITLIYFVYLF